jgi:two-component sensor histidine kinase
VKSMALIHDTLHQSGNMGEIDFAVYVRNLASQLIHAYNIQSDRVTLNFQIDDLLLDINKAIPCGLILNELISNAVKHAFPAGSSGEISIELHTDAARQVTIVVRDTGIGFPVDMEFRHAASLGLQLVCTLIEQLDGTIDLERSEGTAFTLTFRD